MTQQAPDPISLSIQGPVAVMTLQNGAMNAIDDALLTALAEACDEIARRPDVVVLRIRSERRVFSAGADLALVDQRMRSPQGVADMVATVRLFHRAYDKLVALPAVTIAEIGGHALGGGLELALACDFRVAAHQAKLGLPEARVGLLPGAGGTQRLTLLCGSGVAARVILAGDLLDGAEALRVGLAQYAVDAAELPARVDALVAQIAAMSPDSLRACKACIGIAGGMTPEGAKAEIDGLAHLLTTGEARRRVASFLSR